MDGAKEKPLRWVGSSHHDLCALPDDVQQNFGYALYEAQRGDTPVNAKTLRGFGSVAVVELIENDPGGTYRAVYTVRFADAVYVLHCFQKKSTRGIATAKRDLELIRTRLREAEAQSRAALTKGGQQ